jgi:uncharacterized protein YbjT (DUF2867 family)
MLVFGATGMVGQGVLRECLLDPEVELAVTVGRTVTGARDSKLREIVRGDLRSYAGIEEELAGFDACFFCLGVSSGGMKEADYERVTYGLTLAAAETLFPLLLGSLPNQGLSTRDTGRAMLVVAKRGYGKRIMETSDIRAVLNA